VTNFRYFVLFTVAMAANAILSVQGHRWSTLPAVLCALAAGFFGGRWASEPWSP
jgi:hypothetical protein